MPGAGPRRTRGNASKTMRAGGPRKKPSASRVNRRDVLLKNRLVNERNKNNAVSLKKRLVVVPRKKRRGGRKKMRNFEPRRKSGNAKRLNAGSVPSSSLAFGPKS